MGIENAGFTDPNGLDPKCSHEIERDKLLLQIRDLMEEAGVWKAQFERQGEKLDVAERLNQELQNKVTQLLPVAYAALSYWRSDKGDTEAEAFLFRSVEAFELKEGNDILIWQIEEEKRTKTEKRNDEPCYCDEGHLCPRHRR